MPTSLKERLRQSLLQPSSKFDPEGIGYDYETARAFGGKPDSSGHWGSLDPYTGMVLKGRQHPTWDLMVDEETRRGSEIIKRDGRYYSQANQADDLTLRLSERLNFLKAPDATAGRISPSEQLSFIGAGMGMPRFAQRQMIQTNVDFYTSPDWKSSIPDESQWYYPLETRLKNVLEFEAGKPKRERAAKESAQLSLVGPGMGMPRFVSRQAEKKEKEYVESGAKPIDAGESLRRTDWLKKLPFSPIEAAESIDLYKAVQRVKNNDYSYYKNLGLDPKKGALRDKRVITEYLKGLDELSVRDKTFWAQVSEGVTELPAWMIEFGTTGALAKIGGKATVKAGTRLLSKYAQTKAGKIALKGTSWVTRGVIRAAQQPHRIAESYIKRRLPQFAMVEGDIQILQKGERATPALFKAIGGQIIENMSEEAGRTLVAGLEKIPGVAKAKELVGKSVMARWLAVNPGKTATDFGKAIKVGGYDGIVGELGEEWLGRLMHATAGTEDFGTGKTGYSVGDISARLGAAVKEGIKQLPVEATVLATPFAAKVAVSKAMPLRKAAPAKLVKKEKPPAKRLFEKPALVVAKAKPEGIKVPPKPTEAKPEGKVTRAVTLGGRLRFGGHSIPVYRKGGKLFANTPGRTASVDITELEQGKKLSKAKRTALGIGNFQVKFTPATTEQRQRIEVPEELKARPQAPAEDIPEAPKYLSKDTAETALEKFDAYWDWNKKKGFGKEPADLESAVLDYITDQEEYQQVEIPFEKLDEKGKGETPEGLRLDKKLDEMRSDLFRKIQQQRAEVVEKPPLKKPEVIAELKKIAKPKLEPIQVDELQEVAEQKPEPKADAVMKRYPAGNPTVVEKQTGSDTAVYKVVEADDITPSHDPIRFSPRKDYPEGVQERQYEGDKIEQMKVIEAAQDFKPEFLISDNPDAINGPPVVSVDGIVIAGNSRVLTTQRVYKTLPKSAERYKKLLRAKAAQFGVDPKVIAKMKQPILVRELSRTPADLDDMRRLAREYNAPLTQGLSATADAVSRAKNLSNESMDIVGAMLARDESTTIRELLTGVNNTLKIIRSLQTDGVITAKEINRYIDPRTNLLNEDGKTLIEKVLLGKVIDDALILSNIPHGVQRKIERSIPYLAQIKVRGEKWDISDSLKTALDGYTYWDKNTQTLEDFLIFQDDLFGKSPIKEDLKAQALMRLLETRKQSDIKAAFGKYAEKAARDVKGQERLAFTEKPDPEKAFNEAFGKTPKKPKAEKPLFGKTEPGFVYVPRMIRDVIHLAYQGIMPAEGRWKQLGLTGKKLIARALKAHETAQIRASGANEKMHDLTKGLNHKEKDSFGMAVNYIAWEKTPKRERRKRGYRLRQKPISENQRKAAETFLDLADWAMAEYTALGGVRRFRGGGAEPIKGGGIPWPQRFTKEGLRLYAEAMDAVDKDGNPNFDALRHNALIEAMIKDEIAEDVGQAWRKLKRSQINRLRPLYGYFEAEKTPLPAKYMTFNAGDVLGINFWRKMFRTVELARQFGVEHSRVFDYLRAIELEHGKATANEVEKWWDRITGKAEIALTETQKASRRIAFRAGDYQILKLSPLTSAQNFFQRFLSVMEWGPVKTIPTMFKSYTAKARREAREAGAIPWDPFEAGIVGDLRSGEGRAFARMWIEGIGMGVTERGNNYLAAIVALNNTLKDLDSLAKHNTNIGKIAKSVLSLGGDSPSAIKRRLRMHGINWKKALARGHLTIDELKLAALREAKSKHFRSDLFTTPTWWQNSPWWRQVAKYKIPFAYNMMTKCWKLAAVELRHGNLRPALAFLTVTTIAGEIYNGIRGILFGERRDDVSIARRLLQDLLDGGALTLFSSFMFGRDLVEILFNFTAGVWGRTIQNIGRATRDIMEAPEHAPDHILQLIKREIPAIKYLTNIVKKKEAVSRFQRQRIRYEAEKEWTKREGDRYFYYNDLYSAIGNKNKKETLRVLKNLGRLGADTDSTMAALEARRPSKTSLEKRPAMLKTLNKAQLKMIAEEEKDHDVVMGRAHDLIKGDYYQWIARQIKAAEGKKLLFGQRERAKTRLRHLGIKQSQYRSYQRKAEKEKKAQERKKKRQPLLKKAG